MIATNDVLRHLHCCGDAALFVIVCMIVASMATLYLIQGRR